MQRESQKQMANLIAIPVAKEVKTMEVTLGQRMEKLLKEHVDEIMVHLQEDNTKRENMERERTEQMMTLISNILNKDMPAAFEKSAKKELASIGSSIARYISPTIEKAISTAVTETFQV
jgi:enhancer of mRNA-decapping protein 4